MSTDKPTASSPSFMTGPSIAAPKAGRYARATMAHLRTLDVGYGYTADGGRTFPLRGKGVGLMPSLHDVLTAFPGRRFLINLKSNDPAEADLLLAYIDAIGAEEYARLAFWRSARRPHSPAASRTARYRRRRLMQCAKSYVLTGWFGRIGEACRNTILLYRPIMAGWHGGYPDLLLQRMAAETERDDRGPDPPRRTPWHWRRR